MYKVKYPLVMTAVIIAAVVVPAVYITAIPPMSMSVGKSNARYR
jgi:hypothetical protein